MKIQFRHSLRNIVLMTIFSIAPLQAAPQSMLIDDNIVMFVPEGFVAEDHLPSFALTKEPKKIGNMPGNWQTTVEFTQAFGKSIAHIKIPEKTDLYGTGEVTGPLLRNGTTRKLYNTDNFAYLRDRGQKLYQSHPWVLGVREDGTAFGVLADNTWRQEVSLGSGITFTSDSSPFRVFVIERKTPQDVMKALGKLTGTMPLPPLWSLGYQQCRWSYYPDSRVREIADTFRRKKIPCDVIWMDIHYMDGYRVFTFSPEHFPNPEATNAYLHKRNYKSVWMIDPGVKKEKGYFVYDSGTEKDVWIKTKRGDNFVGDVWPGACVFPDFTQPKTNQWWKNLYKDFMATGIDGVWNDMNEPAVFGGKGWTMPPDNMHQGGDNLPRDVHLRYHNVYGMMMVKASRKGIMQAKPNKRPFILSRSNFLGGHRYAATWTGDNLSRWSYLKTSIPMSLNLSLSGQPFNGPDIGGFGENATPELFGHWMAVGAFYPFSRAHSATGTNDHEPWVFGEKIENVSRVALNRRYRLMPYIYTLFREASVNGMPVMRPVFFADITDTDLRTEDQAFLLGRDLLIIPKWAKNTKLPKGNWRTINIVGEESTTDEYQPDLKMRPGSIIPLSDIIQSTADYSLENLDCYVSLDDSGEAEGQLYHDAGDGYGYQKGDYALLTFKAKKQKDNLMVTVSNRSGDYTIKNKKLTIHLIQDDSIITGHGSLTKGVNIQL